MVSSRFEHQYKYHNKRVRFVIQIQKNNWKEKQFIGSYGVAFDQTRVKSHRQTLWFSQTTILYEKRRFEKVFVDGVTYTIVFVCRRDHGRDYHQVCTQIIFAFYIFVHTVMGIMPKQNEYIYNVVLLGRMILSILPKECIYINYF